MNLGRGFKYFLQTTTRFPETNLDLYVPRKLSTTEVNDIVFEHSYRSNEEDQVPQTRAYEDSDNEHEEEDSIERF